MDANHKDNPGGLHALDTSRSDALDDFNLWLILKLTPDFPDPDHLWDELIDYWKHVEASATAERRQRLARRIVDWWVKRRSGTPGGRSARTTSHEEWSALSASAFGQPCPKPAVELAPAAPEPREPDRAEAALNLAATCLEHFLGMACHMRRFGRAMSKRVAAGDREPGRGPARQDRPRHSRDSPRGGEGRPGADRGLEKRSSPTRPLHPGATDSGGERAEPCRPDHS